MSTKPRGVWKNVMRGGWIVVAWLGLMSGWASAVELKPVTLAAWEKYIRLTEQRIAGELNDGGRFLVRDYLSPQQGERERAQLRSGAVLIRKMSPATEDGKPIGVEGGMIHHWIGSIFVPGVELPRLIQWVQDYDRHEEAFEEVEQSQLLAREGEAFDIVMKLKRVKIITVMYNTYHRAEYRNHGPRRVSSQSRATKIAELEDAGKPTEREKPPGWDSGFLWRLNSYWRFEEADGGVYVECESVSLSRALPFGLGWLIRGYVESVPRESLESTLKPIREHLGRRARQ